MTKLEQVLGLPEGCDPRRFQAAYAELAEKWVLDGRAAEFEDGPPASFWAAVCDAVGSEAPAPASSERTSAVPVARHQANGRELRRLIGQLEVYGGACAESRDDIAAAQAGGGVHYNMDFSLLAPVLFDMPSQGSKDFLLSPLAATRRILDVRGPKRPFKIVVSPFTVAEIFDQLQHTLEDLARPVPEMYRAVDLGLLREELSTSSQLRARLHRYTDRGLEASVLEPIKRLSALLESGAVCGIGDIVDVAALRTDSAAALFRRFYGEHIDARLPLETRRKRHDSEFHYKMDAGNNVLTLGVASLVGPSTFFVTTTPLNRRQCRVDGQDLARLDRTPLFVRNAAELRSSNFIDDEVQFVDQLACEAIEHAERMRRYGSLAEVPAWQQQKVATFFRDDLSLLTETSDEVGGTSDGEVEEIVAMLADPNAMRTAVRDAASRVGEHARLLSTESDSLELDYMSAFNLHDDPVLERLRQRLGVFNESGRRTTVR